MTHVDEVLLYLTHRLRNKHTTVLSVGDPLPEGVIEEEVRSCPLVKTETDQDKYIRELEGIFTTRQSRGNAVRAPYKPWLRGRQSSIKFFYWERQKNYYLQNGQLPPAVLSVLDNVTDEILDYCGDPSDPGYWARRGMVMGHVQSGKTTNYSALICKAADAGYKVIILLAGITNSLRAQTQERIDETFIGKVSAFNEMAQSLLAISNVLSADGTLQTRFPAYGTSRDHDFSKVSASTYGVTLAALNEPIIFITKKNKATLGRLAEWLRDQAHGGSIQEPLLLIDDEADNASINTARDPNKITAINSGIREILSMFTRSSYIGYTATPFANIFINPNTEDEMLKDDLFPRDFIKALDPPSNYVGASRVFHEDGDLRDTMVRLIDDYREALPLDHKRDQEINQLPESLERAIRIFVLTRAIRVLRGQGDRHCSMMINVSRFNDVQEKIHGLVYEYLTELRNAVTVNAGLPLQKITDHNMKLLAFDYADEFKDADHQYNEILGVLLEAVSSILVITVNMRGGALDYSKHEKTGLHAIAIGGLALSRGLTLEGLTVSYILRNTAASDTLMQMARWFGYRPGFEKICRLYLPKLALNHYEYVEEAIEELRTEIKRMQSLNQTPKEFGLKVRQSDTALRITAADKMRTATMLTWAADYSGRHVEGHVLFNDAAVNEENLKTVNNFLQKLGAPREQIGLRHWDGVSGVEVLALLKQFSFPPAHPDLGLLNGNTSLFREYLSTLIGTKLSLWDVALPYRKQQKNLQSIFGFELPLRERTKGEFTFDLWRSTGRKNRIADPDDAQLLLSEEEIERARGGDPSARGDGRFCRERQRPLLIVHAIGDTGQSNEKNFCGPVVSLSFCMPVTGIVAKPQTYQVNMVFKRQLSLEFEEDDDEEVMQADD